MAGYLLSLSRKLLGGKLKTAFIMLQFLLLFLIFNVLAYDVWDEKSNHRQIIQTLGTDTYVLDAALQDMDALNDPELPPSWLPSQIEYMRKTFGDRFSYYIEDYRLSAENGNAVDLLFMEEGMYRRVADIYFGGKMLPYFHGGASGALALYSLRGEEIVAEPEYELKKTAVMRYLTLREDRPFLVLPAEGNESLASQEGDWRPLYEGELTNAERARHAEELGRLNPAQAYSFRLLSEAPVERHQYEAGRGFLRLVFMAAAAMMLFAGYVGSGLMLYSANLRSLRVLRLFGASARHVYAIVTAWNALLLLPGCASALVLSCGYIRRSYDDGGEFFVSFLPIPLLLCGALVVLGSLPAWLEYRKDRHVTLNGGLR